MKTIVVIDACVVYQMPVCDTLLRLAEAEVYRLHFSQEILNETTRNLVKKKKMSEKQAVRYQKQIKQHFPESIVEDYEALIPLMTNDLKDRHVLAAAVKIKANVIVTFNLKDFPQESLQQWGIKVQHPDDFLLDLCSDYGVNLAVEIIRQQAADLKKPPITIRELIILLGNQVPNFGKIVFYCRYSPYLSQVALKTLELLGNENQNRILYYEGEEYSFEIKEQTLTIKEKNRGEIFKGMEDTFNCNFTLQDLEKLEEFEQQLDRKIQQSIIKN